MKTVVSKDGTKIAYDVYGNGPALIYITGASCFRNFMPIKNDVKTFAKNFSVFTYDRRGRADSGDTAPYAIEREIEDIAALIDAAGGSAYLYGHSSGAVLALEAALSLPRKVQKAVIYDASYVHDATEKAAYKELGLQTKALLKDGKNAKAMKTFLSGIGMPKPFVALLPLFPGWKTMKTLAPTLAYDIALTEDTPPLKKIAGITQPVHVVVGSKSPKSVQAVGADVAQAIPKSTFQTLEGQDHMVSAEKLLPVLTQFFGA